MAVRAARLRLAGVTVALAGTLTAAFWYAMESAATNVLLLAVTILLFWVNALWTSMGAAVALLGGRQSPAPAPDDPTALPGRCAILWLICGEPPEEVARRVAALHADLARAGRAGECDLFVLSDTRNLAAARAERRAFAGLSARGVASYRRRDHNTGRKPGNVADWIGEHGAGYETMLVLDADSRIAASRVEAMRRRMAAAPHLGLLQSGIRIAPGESRLAGMQRLAARLCGPGFLRGVAAWTGSEGNFWGHNALIRVRAFAGAAGLPVLPGRAPFGGPVLSHDFIEAAWLRRAGWGVEVLPETTGSFEEVPEALAAFHKRDRRWCQGNLQHLRLIGARGLHPVSRLHLLCGIQSFLAAPIWLALVLIFATGAVGLTGAAIWPILAVAAVLLLPKLAGLAEWRAAGRMTPWRRRVLLRAAGVELVLSSLVAPLVMLRQSLSVAAVCAGRDCGWKAPAMPGLGQLPRGALESAAGFGLLALVVVQAPAGGVAMLLLLPVAGPLVAAPLVIRWMDAPVRPAAPRAEAAAAPLHAAA